MIKDKDGMITEEQIEIVPDKPKWEHSHGLFGNVKGGSTHRYEPKEVAEVVMDYFLNKKEPYFEKMTISGKTFLKPITHIERIKSKSTGKDDYSKEDYELVANNSPQLIHIQQLLGLNKNTPNNWCNVSGKAGHHEELCAVWKDTKFAIESWLVESINKSPRTPIGNIFRLKALHNWQDRQTIAHEVQVTDTAKQVVDMGMEYLAPNVDNSSNNVENPNKNVGKPND